MKHAIATGLPPLGEASENSVMSVVGSWMQSFFAVSKMVKRLDRTEGDFLAEVMS